ncbi:hypothetical protein MYCTH_2301313 [Thermothelomyces thermophilus ATCC 42464]|uniref:Chromo domain-containing protein n=1 Tax=Thermothelomyces thermophilus (strain ATCC 42464 / BCRC 31852 / DSM 1799) TaxID=573729 RepID=G2Q9F4_THET4|nr:uncharacterized protein MYCTH_2301313 [Thermothelomyces thermophilus ATCC 42464]AEO56413.1 hypothetical protein MYCTH_2301313 [Thermothelomyces thermophilus ATCC 42464]
MTKRSPAKSTKQKRRGRAAPRSATREQTPDDALYEIRDILDEKLVKGRLLYKVDWADNPATGERYDPTWEPAENVTRAAVADWEREKRRRQGIAPESSSSTAETDSQPVLHPNWRAKRNRELWDAEDEERASKRHRRSVDSGYTSTDGDQSGSWAHVESVPQRKGELVLEISRPPGFDPSEYLRVFSSQSALSSQPADAAASQEEDLQRVAGPVSQRTIPDSQDPFDSLRTQSTARSASVPIECERGSAQDPDAELRISRSDLDIPSRQPGASQRASGRSEGLVETHIESAAQSLAPPSPRLQSQLAPPLVDSPWKEGFLTQPNFELSIFGAETQSFRAVGPQFTSQEPVPYQEQDESSQQHGSAFGADPSLSGSENQAAQRISFHSHNPGLLTQNSTTIAQSSVDVVPDTVPRAPKRSSRSPSQQPFPRQRSPGNERNSPAPFTPRIQRMEGSGEEAPRLSALETVRRIQAEVFGPLSGDPPAGSNQEEPQLASPSAINPPSENFAEHLEASAVPPDSSSWQPPQGDAALMGGHAEYEQPQETVAPADLTTSNQLPDQDVEDTTAAFPDQPDEYPLNSGENEQDEDDDSHEEGRHITVTLPMAANTRAKYLDTVSENKSTLIQFGEVFSNSFSDVPDASLVSKVDAIFEQLLNLCDLPAYDEDLPELGKVDMMKHATNTNSKFSFVYELLQELRDINLRFLIFSQPGRVFEYLEAVISTTGCPYTVLGQEGPTGQLVPAEGASVVLATVGQDLTKVQGVDVVIAFDHAARSAELPQTLGFESTAPIIMSLVAIYSLDHIDQQLDLVEQDLDSLERRNALNVATATAMDYLRNPDRQNSEPHEAAKKFAAFLRNPEVGLDWEPHPLPADIFEIWLSSQERTQNESRTQSHAQMGAGDRKRALSNLDEGIAKRPRLLESQQPSRNATPARMSDLLKQTLAHHTVAGPAVQMVEVPVEQLEKLSAKVNPKSPVARTKVPVAYPTALQIAELESQLARESAIEAKTREHCLGLESQLRSYERTVQSLQPKYMEALRDRSAFEKQCQKAIEREKAATARLEAQTAEIEALREKNKLLESKLAEANNALATSAVPEIARLAQAEKDRAEALAAVERLEKKVRMIQSEAEYSRKAYQDASNAHTELNREYRELESEIDEYKRRASENLRKIHQMHAQGEMAEIARQVDELQALLENRERELERAKEELKVLKNGRRETRQASVPRSPRLGVMSPRPARGMGAGSRGTSPAPPISSDGPGMGGGTDPVPGMTYFPPATNAGRWGHLRE